MYGTAKFTGKETQDMTCLKQGSDKEKSEGCINFKFLALVKEDGLDKDADGILGLSPEMSTDR